MYNSLECIPVFKNDYVSYQRSENQGYRTFLSKKHPEIQALEINSEANEILNLCDGKNTIYNISEIIKEKYEDVELEEVQNDIINLLFSLWRIGIVEWNGNHAFKEFYEYQNGNITYKMLTENETVSILQNFNEGNNENLFHTPFISLDYVLNLSSAVQRVFHGSEEYFTLEVDSKPVLVISLASPLDLRKSLTLALMSSSTNINIEINEFIIWCAKTYEKLTGIQFTRIDIQNTNNDYEMIKSVLDKTDFKEVGILRTAVSIDENVHDVMVRSFNLV